MQRRAARECLVPLTLPNTGAAKKENAMSDQPTTTNEKPASGDSDCCLRDFRGPAVLDALCQECGIVFIKRGRLPENPKAGWIAVKDLMPPENCTIEIELFWSEVGTAKGGVPTHWKFKR